MTRRPTLIVTAFAAVVLLAWAGAYAAMQQAKPTAVAVVDLDMVFKQLKQKQAIEADLRALGDQLQSEEKAKKARIGELQGALDTLPPGGDAYKKNEAKLQEAVIELQVWAQFQQQKITRERAVQLEGLYNKTIETIGQIAKQSGYDLVLYAEPTPSFQGANVQQISAQLSLRKVLWAADPIDLTDTVITRMNSN